MYELIISEKPQAAKKIAEALADKGTLKKKREFNVNYYTLKHKGKDIIVASAVGHLYGLGEKGGESWKYPIFETEWKPVYLINKDAKYTKDYIRLLEKLGKNASEITVASDFDVEGEVIGLNVVRFSLKREDANRMKFSTLTKDALVKAYENKMPHLEWGQAKAGETRHKLDWFYGINLSRAFTESIKKGTNKFKVLSSGRVQAPFLHLLAERERKIMNFKPETFWEIYLNGVVEKTNIKAQYELPSEKIDERKKELLKRKEDENEENFSKISVEKSKIFDKEWKDKVYEETKNRDGKIISIKRREFKQAVPLPFDLTSLQMEANTMFGFTPKKTLEIAQKLYIEGYTSYPRTSSQKLPKDLNLKSILSKLMVQSNLKEKVLKVFEVNPRIKPNEGKKTDPAHPAIFPTGEVPKKLSVQESKLYDLICKRFLAVFGEPAIRETNIIEIGINSHKFVLKGTRTIKKGWHELYEPYLKFEEIELPSFKEGDFVKNEKIEVVEKKTSPPKRYTQASIIKELEKRNLGTKATRAAILENLYNRGYIIDKSIKVTELGLKMDEVLSEELPIIVDEELTRNFEKEMEKIRENKSSPELVLEKAKEELLKVLNDVKEKEVSLGKRLASANDDSLNSLNTIGKCPVCREGTLVIKKNRKTNSKFIACNRFPECKATFKLPNKKIIYGEEGLICPICNYPMIICGDSEDSLRKICINPDCPGKSNGANGIDSSNNNDSSKSKYPEEGMVCPVCKKGHMVLRKSFYGEFLGCDRFPKCKTMMKIVDGKVDTTPITQNGSSKRKSLKKSKNNSNSSKNKD